MHLYLASASPRRAELLTQIGVRFSRLAFPGIDETPIPTETPAEYVQRMAREKALAGMAAMPAGEPPGAVLGADTSVVLGPRILGKPLDRDDARTMLAALAGQAHEVLSAVSLALPSGQQQTLLSTTRVWFRPLANDEIEAYLDTGEPFDKAGSYGIQGGGALLVEQLHGSYSGVVGLPLAETRQLLHWAKIPYWQRGTA
ncbi:Maf family protein [Alcanivorax quisquiliarum]|uniref:dTTP/UTP pyrophosphatase n=1 Tax=Alcanivorax quisquiliarum TaxID=2933565 RepID=A0ABT0E7T7_9GAMM|nr:Maf family nucleotide pyrophosphatase [Alcanivorax quisquiliarum]